VYGTLDHFDLLVSATHERGLRLLLDFVPCHTSIEHPWFREHPDWYIRHEGPEPPNNWRASFGGSVWSRDPLRPGWWYLHSFYPEQPDLNWRNAEVVDAMSGVVRFWLDRGVDGFRLDALDRLLKDPELRDDPPAEGPPPLPLHPEHATLEHRYSRDAPDIGTAVGALRAAAGDAFLVGEVHLPSARLDRYLEHLDSAFCFELFHSPWDSAAVRAAIEAALAPRGGRGRLSWMLSNHDFSRLPDRVGPENVRAAAMLLLTLPGMAFLYQGDEIGMPDGPGNDPPYDRMGRDRHRHPMQWDATPTGGFTTGEPWLPLVDPARRNVAEQRSDPESLLALVRALIALRPQLGTGLRFVDGVAPGVLAYELGEHVVALNFAAAPRDAPGSELLLATDPQDRGGRLAPHAGRVTRKP
jgi:alpha-glucosidase